MEHFKRSARHLAAALEICASAWAPPRKRTGTAECLRERLPETMCAGNAESVSGTSQQAILAAA